MSHSIPKRHLTFIGLFLTLMVSYVYRTSLSPTVLVMFQTVPCHNTSNYKDKGCPDKKNTCPAGEVNCTKDPCSSGLDFTPRMNLSSEKQSQLLSAYFYGYTITNFLGAIATFVYGPRIIMIIGLVGSTVFTALTIGASYVPGYEYALIFTCRFMIGLFLGPLYTAIQDLIARWSPIPELTRNAVLAHSGNIVGLIVAFGFGYFVDYSLHAWEYYLAACATIYWCIFVYDQPWLHPTITDDEREYIMASLHPNGKPKDQTIHDIPLKNMLSCKYLYILCCAHVGNNFILYTFLTNHAKYLNKYFKISPSMASVYSIIPFSFNTLCQFLASFTITNLQRRVKKPVTFHRKVSGCIGFLIAPLFLFPVGFVGCGGFVVAEVLLTLSMGILAYNQAGFFPQIIEISPPHASLTMGFTNMMASIPGFVTSPILTALINAYGITDGYKYYFIITACITIAGGVVWILFSSSERQYWENPKKIKASEANLIVTNNEEKVELA